MIASSLPRRFSLDANILIYAAMEPGDAKSAVAKLLVRQAVDAGGCMLSIQAIGEFYHAGVRKQRLTRGVAARQAASWLGLFTIVEPNVDDVHLALAAAAGGRSSYWDGLLLATVERHGCSVLYSEDMAETPRHWGRLAIQNPMRGLSGE